MLSSGSLRFCLGQAESKGAARSMSDFKVIAVKAEQLLYCIIRNHPFLDGNKRTAYEWRRCSCSRTGTTSTQT